MQNLEFDKHLMEHKGVSEPIRPLKLPFHVNISCIIMVAQVRMTFRLLDQSFGTGVSGARSTVCAKAGDQ